MGEEVGGADKIVESGLDSGIETIEGGVGCAGIIDNGFGGDGAGLGSWCGTRRCAGGRQRGPEAKERKVEEPAGRLHSGGGLDR